MFSKLVTLCALVAVSQAGLLAEPVHYSSAAAVSSQSIVRHDQPQIHGTKLVASSVNYQAEPTHITYQSAPLAYQTAPVHYSSAGSVSSQSIVSHEQPQIHGSKLVASPITYQAEPAHITYQTAPAHYSSAESVSSQNIVRHEQPQIHGSKLVASPITYQAEPAHITYQTAPAHYSSAESVSSQNIVRHEQPQIHDSKLVASPITYQAEPAHITYQSAPVAYQSSPAHYSSAESVSSQNIVRHEQPQAVAYHSAPASYAYHAATTPVAYQTAGQELHYSAPVAVAHQAEKITYPKYEYTYSVADGHTGDNKSQQETRDGDAVKGSYSFHEADGSIRTVEYTADAHSGFNAVVHNTAPTNAPVLVKAAPAYGYAEPTLQYYKH